MLRKTTIKLAACLGMLLFLLLVPDIDPLVQAKSSDFEIADHVLIDYLGSETVVTVPDGVQVIGENAFSQSSQITQVVLPDSVTRINFGAFQDCEKLESVNIPDKVINIGNNLFDGCKSLKKIDLPDNLISIGDSAFMDCSGLTSVTIPDGVVILGWYAFYGCTSLSEIFIPSSLEHIGLWAFEGTKWLSDYQGDALIINNLLVRYLGTEQKYTVPEDTTEIVDGAFLKNTELKEVRLPDTVVSIGNGAFEDCTGLTKITIPEGVTTIGSGAFYGCSSLEEIDIPASVIEFGEHILKGTPYYETYPEEFFVINGVLLEYTGQQSEVIIPDKVTVIAPKAFTDKPEIQKIIIPDGVKKIKATCIFRCNGLKQIVIPESAADIDEEAVLWCESNITIYGVTGSAAEELAKLNSFGFKGYSLNHKNTDMKAGKTLTLKVLNCSSKIVWKSSDSSIAKIDSKGKVKALKTGKVTITALADNITCTCNITVTSSAKKK